jgi:hypothetical protein
MVAEEERRRREENIRKDLERTLQNLKRMGPHFRKEVVEHGGTEWFSVVDRTEKYVQSAHGGVVVTSVEKIVNCELERKFIEAKLRLKGGIEHQNVMPLFHGTGVEGIKAIPNTGFRLPQMSEDNMFGQGVYFATDSSKSAQKMYTKDSNCLLLCDVLLGKACKVEGLKSEHGLVEYVKTSTKKQRPYLDVDEEKVRTAGFDSVFAPRDTRDKGGVQFDEFVIYNPSQALPRYIVHFSSMSSMPSMPRVQGQSGLPTRLPDGTIRYHIDSKRLGSEHSEDLVQYNFAVGHLLHLLGHHKPTSKPSSVHVYDSEKVKKAYEAKKEEFEKKYGTKPSEVWVFHGTKDLKTVERICCEGFKVGGEDVDVANGSAYGKGVYTARGPDTPMGYSDDKSVILSLALEGKVGEKAGQDVDSWTPAGHKDWKIFATGAQLWPRYAIIF